MTIQFNRQIIFAALLTIVFFLRVFPSTNPPNDVADSAILGKNDTAHESSIIENIANNDSATRNTQQDTVQKTSSAQADQLPSGIPVSRSTRRYPTVLEVGISVSEFVSIMGDVRYRFHKKYGVGIDQICYFSRKLISNAKREGIGFSPMITMYPFIDPEKMANSRVEIEGQVGVGLQFLEGGMLPSETSISPFIGVMPRILHEDNFTDLSLGVAIKIFYLARGNAYFDQNGLLKGSQGGCFQPGAVSLIIVINGSIGFHLGDWR
jgi:hypothetical protein